MDDAAECFENILNCIHYHLNQTEDGDTCAVLHCITHQKFAMNVLEEYTCTCNCGSSLEPHVYTQLVHYVSAASLVYHAPILSSPKVGLTPSSLQFFGRLLHLVGTAHDFRQCSNKRCQAPINTYTTLLNKPEIISIGLVWDSESASIQSIKDVLALIGTQLRPEQIFGRALEFPNGAAGQAYSLVGFVAYYGMHYSAFCFHTRQKTWVYLDDSHVRKVGKKWSDVVDECRKAHYQPLLLVYASPNTVPIETESALKTTLSVPLVAFRSKCGDASPKSDLLETEHAEKRLKSTQSNNEHQQETSSPSSHEVTGCNQDSSPQTTGGLQSMFLDSERLVNTAQQLEAEGKLHAALDCYSQASAQYRKAMMMSPMSDHSRRFDEQMKRDRCFQRSRSLSLKLNIRRQTSRESPSGTSATTIQSPQVGDAPTSMSPEHLPVVKEGILIDIGEAEDTHDLLGTGHSPRLRTGKL
jgi:hypothetical protein